MKKLKKTKASTSAAPPKASRAKPLATAPPEDSVQSEDLSRISKNTEMRKSTDQALTAAAILRNDAIDLSSDEDLADDALEQLIKSKEEAEIFNDLPLFDVAIIHNFCHTLVSSSIRVCIMFKFLLNLKWRRQNPQHAPGNN